MLVLSRQAGEQIMIGDNIIITIVKIHPYRVRLGITAPEDIPVHRQEVYKAIGQENTPVAQPEQRPPPADTPSVRLSFKERWRKWFS